MKPGAIQPQPLSAFYFHPPFSDNYFPDILDEIYKKQVYKRFLPNKTTGTVCLDIGSNVGLSVYYFSQHFEKVIAVEPAKQHLESLTAMTKTNNLSNVTIAPYAVSNNNGKTKFYHNPNQTAFTLSEQAKNDNFEEVETITIDSLFDKYKIDHVDLLKLDVEGEEGKVINSEGFKKVASKIKVIAGEWHDWSGVSQMNFQHAIEDLGFHFKWRFDTQAKVFEATRL